MRRRGFSAPELAMAVLLIMLATAALMAANRRAARRARDIHCMNNLQQLSLGLRLYAADHNYRLPPSPTAWDAAYPYVRNSAIFVCPLAPRAEEPEQEPTPPAAGPAGTASGPAAPEEEPLVSDYLLNPAVQTDDLPSFIIAGDDCPDRHAGERWIGVRLDGAVQLLSADEWASRLGEVTEDAEHNE